MRLIKINTVLSLLNILEFYDSIIPLSILSDIHSKNIEIIKWPSYITKKDQDLFWDSIRYRKRITKVEIKITTNE